MTDVMKYQIVSAVFFQIILCLIIIHGVYLFRMGMDTISTFLRLATAGSKSDEESVTMRIAIGIRPPVG